MTVVVPPSRQEADRLREYDRWLRSAQPDAIALRWLMGDQGQFLANGPALRLPINLKLNTSARILDIGCGRGALLRTFDDQLQLETAPVGLDFSRVALRLAARDGRRRRRRGSVRLTQGAATALPFRDGAFTVVTCGYVVKHLDDAELDSLLGEIHRVLAPGGLAVVWEFGPSGNARLDAWNARVISLGVGRPRLRSGATLRRHAQDAGFAFAREADLRPFLLPPIARASILIGRPPEGWTGPLG